MLLQLLQAALLFELEVGDELRGNIYRLRNIWEIIIEGVKDERNTSKQGRQTKKRR